MSHVRPSRTSLVIAAVVGAIVTIAVFRLPESLIAQIENARRVDDRGAGIVFGLLAAIASAQAVYGGFVALSRDRARAAVAEGNRPQKVVDAAGWLAAAMVLLTFVYGGTSLALTAQRAGFWLFVFIAATQWAWYVHQTGRIAADLAFVAVEEPHMPPAAWRASSSLCPPLARGMTPTARPDDR